MNQPSLSHRDAPKVSAFGTATLAPPFQCVRSGPNDVDSPAGRSTAPTRWRWTAALAAAAAGALHIGVAADHLDAGQLVVGFFLLTSFAQLGLAVWLVVTSWPGVQPSPRLIAAALAGTVALIGLYLIGHTTDLLASFHGPAGVGAHDHALGTGTGTGHAIQVDGPIALGGQLSAGEPPTLLGTATVAVELLAVTALAALLPPSWRGRAVNALLALGVLAWVLWLTGVLG